MAIGSSIGSTIGGVAGTAFGGPLGAALGTAAGGLIGGAIEAIPALVKTEAEKENERRLRQLQRMQEMGTLGLTEAEKQALYTAGQSQAAGALRQAQQLSRAAGAAGMQTGAGTEQLRQAQLAQGQAQATADVARNVEMQNLARKRELEAEIEARTAALSQAKQEALQAVTGTISGALAGGLGEYKLAQEQMGKMPSAAEIQQFANLMGLTTDDARGFLEFKASTGMSDAVLEGLFAGKK